LEPVRQYALEFLARADEMAAVRRSHAMYFIAFAETLERDASVGGSRRHVAVQLLLREYRNLQAALQWTLDARDPTVGLRLARTLQLIWKEHGLLGEGLGWIHALLELPGAEAPTPARAVALLT